MKRITIIVVIAILLLACFAGVGLILLLLVFPFAYYTIKFKEKREPSKVMYATIEDVESKYGEPDDVVVLDASRANELPCLVLFYSAQDVMIAAWDFLQCPGTDGLFHVRNGPVSLLPARRRNGYTAWNASQHEL